EGEATVEVERKEGTKIEQATNAVTTYAGGSVAGKVEADVLPAGKAVADVKVDAQRSLRTEPGVEPQASVKLSAEGALGIQNSLPVVGDIMSGAKAIEGEKVEVEVKAPLSLDAVSSGRTFSEARVEVKTSTTQTAEAAFSAKGG